MIRGEQMARAVVQLGYSHVVWLPDSLLGTWEDALQTNPQLSLIRICREGEAWAIAAGLQLGGQSPLVMMQTTGLFESGDALRNVVFDLGIPVQAIIGARNWLNTASNDSARRFAMPVIEAWGLPHIMMDQADQFPSIVSSLRNWHANKQSGLALIAEGRL